MIYKAPTSIKNHGAYVFCHADKLTILRLCKDREMHTNRHILSGASKLQVGQVLLTYLQVSCKNLDMRCACDFVIYHHFLKKSTHTVFLKVWKLLVWLFWISCLHKCNPWVIVLSYLLYLQFVQKLPQVCH